MINLFSFDADKASLCFNRTLKSFAAGLCVVAGLTVTSVRAETLGLNPDNLSFFEEPLAFDLFGFTVTYNQLIDLPAVFDFENDDEDFFPRSNFQVSVERQLANALTIGGTYFGSYDDRDNDEYEDRWAVYASSVWGRTSFGEVTDAVREVTRRWRGTGNAELEFDDVLSNLKQDEIGGAYSIRLSAFTFNAAVDDDGNSDFGITYDRPNKYIDIRLTGRFTDSEVISANNAVIFDANAGVLVAQVEYGSLAVDLQVGYEHLSSSVADGNRVFISSGIHYKVRRLTLSAEGHWGEIDNDTEKSLALGARYDLARGLSINLGYNYADSQAAIDGIVIQNVEKSELITSLRYEF